MFNRKIPVSGSCRLIGRSRFFALPVAAAMLVGGGLGVGAQSRAASHEVGVWYDDTGEGAVEIKQCGNKLCGYIYWLKDPISTKTGRPLADLYNPEPDKRGRPICGLQVLGGLARQNDGSLDEGWVYDPKVGKSYDAAIQLEGRSQLILTGYKGVKFLSKSFTWNRAPGDLPRCSQPE